MKMLPRKVTIYIHNFIPQKNGTGPDSRIYSNIRAYQDLGFEVDIVWIGASPQTSVDTLQQDLDGVASEAYGVQSKPLLSTKRVSYWLNFPLLSALDYLFPTRPQLRQIVSDKEELLPGQLHHFEYLSTAVSTIGLPKINSIWSCNDIESTFRKQHLAIRQELEGRVPNFSERRALRLLQRSEKLTSAQCKLVLCISDHEREILKNDWNCKQAEFLPMSIPVEVPPQRQREWFCNGRLRLLHLGRIDSLPSFWSLRFLLTEVFPLLDEKVLSQLEMYVVGEVRDSTRAKTLLDIMAQYPQIKILGYQRDIRSIYAKSDVQVVGSTVATGLRTRIIESLAWKLPIISTEVGAQGIVGLENLSNILLATTARQFADHITSLVNDPSQLKELSSEGRKTYDLLYSRAQVSSQLDSILSQYFQFQEIMSE